MIHHEIRRNWKIYFFLFPCSTSKFPHYGRHYKLGLEIATESHTVNLKMNFYSSKIIEKQFSLRIFNPFKPWWSSRVVGGLSKTQNIINVFLHVQYVLDKKTWRIVREKEKLINVNIREYWLSNFLVEERHTEMI